LAGVWTEPDAGANAESGAPNNSTKANESKIAALGVHISGGVSSHGIALNVNTDLSFFDLIIPCGIASKPVTSMSSELGHPVALQEVAHSLSRNFGSVFNSQVLWLDTLDDLLGTKTGVPMTLPNHLRKIHPDDGSTWA